MTPRNALIDWEQLDMIADGFPPDFVEIYRAFEADFPRILAIVRRGLAARDAVAVADAAHQAKGSCGNFGFVVVSAAMAAIEKSAKAGVLDGMLAKLNAAEADFWESLRLVRVERGV